MIQVGSKVYLRGLWHGQPGTVLRIERRRMAVLWHDLDYLAHHPPESLVEALPEETTDRAHRFKTRRQVS